jgi:hypothetical protein
MIFAEVAQSVEQLFCKQRVGGSIPFFGLNVQRRFVFKGRVLLTADKKKTWMTAIRIHSQTA